MKRRIFSFIITLCMIFSLVPVSGVHVHAEAEVCTHTDNKENERDEDGVCTVCGNECEHSWNNYEGKCDNCGATHIHTYCGYEGYPCEKCGYKEIGYHFDLYPHDGLCDVCEGSLPESTGPADENGNMSNTTWYEVVSDETGHWIQHKTTGEKDTVNAHTWSNGVCSYTSDYGACGYKCKHDWSNKDGKCAICDAVCEHVWVDGVCDVCGAGCNHDEYDIKCVPSTDAHTHVLCCENCGFALYGDTGVGCSDYNDYNGYCDKCGLSIYCYGGEATCTEKAKCELCGKEYGQTPVGHDWSNKDGICAKEGCGVAHEPHEWDKGVCAVCGVAHKCDFDNLEYKHNEGTATHDWLCPVCGYLFADDAKCIDNDPDDDGICDKCEYEYEHKNHDWSNKDGICAKEGCGVECEHPEYEDGKCTVCGAACKHTTYKYEHIEGTEGTASKHTWLCACGWVISAEWPCSDKDGDFICDKCGYQLHTHDWSNKDGVCAGGCGTECKHPDGHDTISNGEGKHYLECPDCGHNYGGMMMNCTDGNGDGKCDSCEYELFHNWSNKDGVCKNCGEVCEHPVEKWNYISDGEGKHTAECIVCGDNVLYDMYLPCEDRDGDRFCESCGYEVYHLHDWSNKDGVCVTCGENCEHETDYVSDGEGKHTLLCTICDVEYITGKCYSYDDGLCDACEYEIYHYSKTPATCTEGAVCDHCGEAYADALDHDWSNKDGKCARGCGATCEHPNEKAVSNGKGQHMLECPDCGNTYGDLWLNCREGEVAGVCGSCDYEMYHAGGTPTCAEQAICQNCGLPYGETLPHTWTVNVEKSEASFDAETKNFTVAIECACGAAYPMTLIDAGEPTVTQNADCEKPELTTYTCVGYFNGVEYKLVKKDVETAPATGIHNYEVVKSEPATCKYPAYYWYECSVCGAEKNGEDKTGALADHVNNDGDNKCDVCDEKLFDCDHEGTDTYTESMEATCSAEGYINTYCKDCNELVSEEILEKNDNHFFYNGVCMRCGGLEEEVACDHEGKGTYTFTVDASCSEEGIKEVYCSGCAQLISSEVLAKNDNHVFFNGSCLLCGEAEVKECEHNYEVVKVQEADCQYPAYYWYECTICGEEMNREEGSVGEHKYELVKEQAADCQYPAYYWFECTVCGAEKNYEDKTGTLGEHDYKLVKEQAADCQYPAYYWFECTVCGAEKNYEDKTGTLGEHDYEVVKFEPATCQYPAYYWYECTLCGEEMNREEGEADSAAHNHEAVVTAPTCEDAGYTTYTCACGDTYTADEVAALGHAWNDGEVTTEPTEEAEGVMTYTCGVCGEIKTEAIEKIEHVHNHEAVVTAPTCDEAGYTTYTCACGDTYTADEVAALGHAWNDGEVTTEPTEEAEGVMTYTCGVCGEIKTEAIEKIEHVHNHEAVVTAPTCDEAGYTTYTCACGDTYTGDEVEALGHAWNDGEVTTEPTEEAEGVMTYTCGVCGETKTEAIEKLEHVHNHEAVVTAPTCDEAGYTTYTCACGDTYIADEVAALGHAWNDGEVTTEPTEEAEGVMTYTCGVCGETKTEAIEKIEHVHNHEAVVTAPTCEDAGYTTYTCACGDTYIADEVAALGHLYTYAIVDGKPVKTCTRENVA